MKNLIATLIFLCLSILCFGQGVIKGKVMNGDNMPAGGVNISALRAMDSLLVKINITDAGGNFEVTVADAGVYLLKYSNIGYEVFYSGAFTLKDGQTYTVPDVTLAPSSTNLNDVTVAGKKPLIEISADKTVYNIANSINATGSNAMELLQKTPGVLVDNNDNINVRGKTGVRIYVDGKMNQLSTKDLSAYLRSINNNDVDAIEMISNPGAKYDASGNAGIINIRLKKNKQYGLNGSASAGYVQGISGKENGAVSLNYRNKRLNVFGNISGNTGTYETDLNFKRTQKDTLYDLRSINKSSNKTVNAKAGADFFINNTSTIGVLATANYTEGQWSGASNNNIYYAPTDSFVKYLSAANTTPTTRANNNLNVNYRYADTTGTEVNIDADYGLFNGRGNSLQPNNYYDINNAPLSSITYRNITPTDINIYSLKGDAEHKLWKGKMGYGAKISYVETRNNSDYYNLVNGADVMDASMSNKFDYTEQVTAAYVNYQYMHSPAFNVQAGLRAENTASKGVLKRDDGLTAPDNTVQRNYTDLFPSASATWNINKINALNIAYSRRIDRPTYQDLNPFEIKLDELSYEKGNAFLRPQYTNSVELTHTYMSYLVTKLGYSYVQDYATQVTDTVANASYIQQQNIATQKIISLSTGIPIPIRKWWTGYVYLWYSYQMFKGQIGASPFNLSVPMYGAYVQQSITLPASYSAEISGYYNGPAIWAGTWQVRPTGSIDIGFQKQFADKRLSVKLSFTDILYTQPWYISSDFGGMKLTGNGRSETRTARVNITYRFGNKNVRSARQRKGGLDSEAKRIKSGK